MTPMWALKPQQEIQSSSVALTLKICRPPLCSIPRNSPISSVAHQSSKHAMKHKTSITSFRSYFNWVNATGHSVNQMQTVRLATFVWVPRLRFFLVSHSPVGTPLHLRECRTLARRTLFTSSGQSRVEQLLGNVRGHVKVDQLWTARARGVCSLCSVFTRTTPVPYSDKVLKITILPCSTPSLATATHDRVHTIEHSTPARL
jgi:hypothetical protein